MFISCVELLVAQSARMSSLGGNPLITNDVWQVSYNPSALTGIEKTSIMAGYDQRFGMKELSNRGLAMVFPKKRYAVAAGFSYFGVNQYQNMTAHFATARKLGDKSSLGIRFGWYYNRIPASQSSDESALLAGAGYSFQLSSKFTIGAQFSVFQDKLKRIVAQHLMPPTFSAGGQWKPIPTFALSFSGEADQKQFSRWRGGLEWNPLKSFAIRAGMAGHPDEYFFGLGYSVSYFTLDFSFGYHVVLGYSPVVTLTLLL
jgi:hypothetical protein